MNILNLVQGTEEWKAVRLSHFTASEAPAMMGASKYMSREELLNYKTTHNEKEVSKETQKIFDLGHLTEDQARPFAEALLGEDLYPVTGAEMIEGLPLLASFDGLTLCEDTAFEHKQWNKEKAAKLDQGEILPEHYWQLEHQLLVSGAESVLFMFSDGTDENMVYKFYESFPKRRAQLIAGWKQFQKDLDSYQPQTYQEKPEAEAIMDLPALTVQLVGEVKQSNLAVYQKTAMDLIKSINTDLQTDQDFANAEKMVKFCDKTEKDLELVKKQALSQTADIDLLFRTVDSLKEAMRVKRLELNKLVKSKKDQVRGEIFTRASNEFVKSIGEANADIKPITLPEIQVDFNGAMKSKRTIKSLNEAVNDELARARIEIETTKVLILNNLTQYSSLQVGYDFLFNDLQQIILKDADDFAATVKTRITEHQEAEKARKEAEREQIRREEEAKAQAKLEAEARAKAQAEAKASSTEKPFAKPMPKPQAELSAPSMNDLSDVLNSLDDEIQDHVEEHPAYDDIIEFLCTETDLSDYMIAKEIARAIVIGKMPHVSLNQDKQTKAA